MNYNIYVKVIFRSKKVILYKYQNNFFGISFNLKWNTPKFVVDSVLAMDIYFSYSPLQPWKLELFKNK